MMKMISLGDICDIKGGKRLPKGEAFSETVTDHKYIRARDIRNCKIRTEDIQYISKEIYNKISNYTVLENDVCVTIVGANIGDIGIITNELSGANLTENAVKLSNFSGFNPFFVMYYLSLNRSQEEMKKLAAGAAQPKLGIYKVKTIQIPNCDIMKQNKIVDTISKYDDLIENNFKRIKLLEEAAELIYKEWFVNFRFWGYEKYKFVDGIPKGWSKKVVQEVVEFNIGGGWGKEEKDSDFTEIAYVIRGTDIPKLKTGSNKNISLRFHKESNLKSRKLVEGDIVFEASGGSKGQPVGRALYVSQILLDKFDISIMCASFCKLIRAKNPKVALYLYYFVNELRNTGSLSLFESQSASNIINFKFKDFLNRQEIILPDECIITKFYETVMPIIKKLNILTNQIVSLKEARDILIPKLITGEIEV